MRISIRVYYEDTDCGGVVYYANYLKYFERGRTELLRGLGVSLPELHASGIVFVVTRAEAEYLRPARYGDLLTLETRVVRTTRATTTFEHVVGKEGLDKEVARGTVVLASVGKDGRPVGMPEGVRAALDAAIDKG